MAYPKPFLLKPDPKTLNQCEAIWLGSPPWTATEDSPKMYLKVKKKGLEESTVRSIKVLLPAPYSLLPTPYSLLPTPFSLLPTPYSLLPTPYSLLPTPKS